MIEHVFVRTTAPRASVVWPVDVAPYDDQDDADEMTVAAILPQLEAWREAWQAMRVSGRCRMTPELERESIRLARRVREALA